MFAPSPMALQVSARTLLAARSLLAAPQEDRRGIREAQDLDLWRELRDVSSLPLAARHRERFYVAPLDLLPVRQGGRLRFQLLELNGTGIGGLTNLPEDCVATVLSALSELPAAAQRVAVGAPVVLVGISGGPSVRANPLAHEKGLYADALARGFERLGLAPEVCTLDAVLREAAAGRWSPVRPTVVLGYSRAFLPHVAAARGRLTLRGVPVAAVVNDRLFQNILHRIDGAIDPGAVVVANGCHAVGSDKGRAIQAVNAFLRRRGAAFSSLRPGCAFEYAHDRDALVAAIARWLGERRAPVVAKPCGTGGGDGIEFFLDLDEPPPAIAERVGRSVAQTTAAYGTSVFPYTLCEYLDGATWPGADDPLFGHKFELRVVVYRDEQVLRAFPSIVKLACEAFDPRDLRRPMLINNITAGAHHTGAPGHRWIRPLCNRATLAALEVAPELLAELCRFATAFVHAVLDDPDGGA